jgi:hypothetical protein
VLEQEGIRFPACRGIRGLLVQDEAGLDTVFLLGEPASHDCRVMTRSDRRRVLVERAVACQMGGANCSN